MPVEALTAPEREELRIGIERAESDQRPLDACAGIGPRLVVRSSATADATRTPPHAHSSEQPSTWRARSLRSSPLMRSWLRM
jgi:hypothetical protein